MVGFAAINVKKVFQAALVETKCLCYPKILLYKIKEMEKLCNQIYKIRMRHINSIFCYLLKSIQYRLLLVMSLTCIFQLVFEIPSHKYDVLITTRFCHGDGVQIFKL